MKQLRIDLDELALAFQDSSSGLRSFLDTKTGQILIVTAEASRELEQIYEDHYDPDAPDAFDLEGLLDQADVQDWQKEDLLTADFVEEHYGDRVIAVSQTTSHEAYDDMQSFIARIRDDWLYNELRYETRGRGAFSRFKYILAQRPAEQQRWYAFEEERSRQRIISWLEENGIEPIETPPGKEDLNSYPDYG